MNEAPAAATASTSCAGVDCDKPASSLACPTCLKLGITTSKFCDQDCFKRSWATHKAVHVQTQVVNGIETYDPFPSRIYTGTLRACYQKNKLHNPRDPTQRRPIPSHVPKPNYADDIRGDPKYSMLRERTPRQLNAEEIAGMREACRVSREVLDHAASHIKPGITTDELDAIVHEATVSRGAYPSPLNYRNFPKSVCTSVNEVICHGIPDLRPLKEGDIVNLDVSCYYKGYHGDLNATYPVGTIDEDSQRLIRTARECLDAAIALAKPGTLYRDFGAVIEKVATANKCSVNKTYCGHGINNLFHTAPSIPHYSKNKAPHFLKPGHTFTIEPMICLGAFQETHWPDDWTAVTVDGKRSAQFEETLLVTETGIEILTAAKPAAANGTANGHSSEEKAKADVQDLTDKVKATAL